MDITIVFKQRKTLSFEHCFDLKILDNKLTFTDNKLQFYEFSLAEIINLFIY